jgi:hypothetical protein
MLNEAYEKGSLVVFEHDVYNECCDLKKTPKGIRVNQTMKLKDALA